MSIRVQARGSPTCKGASATGMSWPATRSVKGQPLSGAGAGCSAEADGAAASGAPVLAARCIAARSRYIRLLMPGPGVIVPVRLGKFLHVTRGASRRPPTRWERWRRRAASPQAFRRVRSEMSSLAADPLSPAASVAALTVGGTRGKWQQASLCRFVDALSDAFI